MSRPFAHNNAKTTFAQINQPFNASDYIRKKRQVVSKPAFCCTSIKPFSYINKSQLYINLYTKLNLDNIAVISDVSGNEYPVKIDTNITYPYLIYNIDPSGSLFGNTVCGIQNFEHYLRCQNS